MIHLSRFMEDGRRWGRNGNNNRLFEIPTTVRRRRRCPIVSKKKDDMPEIPEMMKQRQLKVNLLLMFVLAVSGWSEILYNFDQWHRGPFWSENSLFISDLDELYQTGVAFFF